MNKKYELIADGANKRIKALRSFKVQDRYVNIGDVGGIVYDEKPCHRTVTRGYSEAITVVLPSAFQAMP